MKDQKNNPTKTNPAKNNLTQKNDRNQKKDLRSMSMGDLLKLAREKNLPIKLDLNKEGLIKVIEASTK